MRPRSAKNKGWLLEDFMVKHIRNKGFDKKAIRTPGSGAGRIRGDVYTPNLAIRIECKNTKTASINEWIKQASDQTYGYLPYAIVWHPPRVSLENSAVIIPLELFDRLLASMKLHDE